MSFISISNPFKKLFDVLIFLSELIDLRMSIFVNFLFFKVLFLLLTYSVKCIVFKSAFSFSTIFNKIQG